MSISVANQLFVAYLGRPADSAWQSSTAGLLDLMSDKPSSALQSSFYNAAVADGRFSLTDSTSTLVNKIFLNTFGFAASTFEQTAWSDLVTKGAVSKEGLAWTIFASYLSATNVPAIYQQPAQSKLIAAQAFTSGLTASANAAYSQLNSSASATGVTFLNPVISQATAAAAITPAALTASYASVTNSSGTTFTLTTGTDAITGTAGNDTFVGTASDTAAATDTFTAVDTLVGGAGTDLLSVVFTGVATASGLPAATVSGIETINIRSVQSTAATVLTVTTGNFAGALDFNSDRSTSAVTFSTLAAGQSFGMIGNGAITNGALVGTYANSVAAGVINITGGTTAGAITENGTGITSNIINSTGTAKNTVGAIVLSGSADTALTINAAAALVTGGITGFTGTTSTITVLGAATNSAGSTTSAGNAAVALGTIEAATVGTINASGLTAGGISAVLNANTSLVVTGGAGNDLITTGVALVAGSVNAGAGTGDRLVMNASADIATTALGAKYSGFEVISMTAGQTLDMDNLVANNTFTGMRVIGNATYTNVNAATAANVQVTASDTLSLGVKGATTPGQTDIVNLTINDESAVVNIITMTAPVLAGIETLNITANDSLTVTTMANALALKNITVTGAGNVIFTTLGAVALQANYDINAGTLTGNLTVDGTSATTNGFNVTGGAGINLITGGTQVMSANLSASTAKADVITLTSATGGTDALPNATISGFTNSATVAIGDRLELDGVAVVGKAGVTVAATATAVVPTMTEAVSATGLITFAGAGAATATLANKIAAALETTFLGNAILQTGFFEHAGNTYVVENIGVAGYVAGADYVIQLTGVTGMTALSTTASAATTIWAS